MLAIFCTIVIGANKQVNEALAECGVLDIGLPRASPTGVLAINST